MTGGRRAWLRRCGAATVAAGLSLSGCKRHADVRDELVAPRLMPPPTIMADTHPVDSGLGTAAFPECTTRPFGECQGTNDFPCAFPRWAIEVAKRCQELTGCNTDGHLDVEMASNGCVNEIRMSDPNEAIVACLAHEFGSVKCPCGQTSVSYFLGLGNHGCQLCGGQEFPCPAGLACVRGACQPMAADAGGRSN